MPVSQCRLCGRAFLGKPLLRYENMPQAAQFLPDADALANERGVALEVRQCSGCGLVQLSNDPVPYYREVIRAAGRLGREPVGVPSARRSVHPSSCRRH